MNQTAGISLRAAMVAVVVAALVGVVASLAIRPPGQARAPVVSGEATAATETINWKLAGAFNTTLPVLGESILFFVDTLAAASGGALKMKAYEPGELAPAFSITDAVREGKVQAGITWVGYDQGRIPAAPLIASVPFGLEPWEYMAWWYAAGGQALGEAMYQPHGVHPVLCGLIGPETAGWFAQPIESTEDIDGLKIRFSGLGGRALQRLGASVTILPAAEIFQALEKGAIDATEFSLPAIDQLLGFGRVAQYNYFPGWHQPSSAMHLLVNLPLWQSLQPATRQAINTSCMASVTHSLAVAEASQGAAVRDAAAAGTKNRRLPPETLAELARAVHEVLDEEAAKDAQFARVLNSQREFFSTYAHWKHLGYLPRDFASAP